MKHISLLLRDLAFFALLFTFCVTILYNVVNDNCWNAPANKIQPVPVDQLDPYYGDNELTVYYSGTMTIIVDTVMNTVEVYDAYGEPVSTK